MQFIPNLLFEKDLDNTTREIKEATHIEPIDVPMLQKIGEFGAKVIKGTFKERMLLNIPSYNVKIKLIFTSQKEARIPNMNNPELDKYVLCGLHKGEAILAKVDDLVKSLGLKKEQIKAAALNDEYGIRVSKLIETAIDQRRIEAKAKKQSSTPLEVAFEEENVDFLRPRLSQHDLFDKKQKGTLDKIIHQAQYVKTAILADIDLNKLLNYLIDNNPKLVSDLYKDSEVRSKIELFMQEGHGAALLNHAVEKKENSVVKTLVMLGARAENDNAILTKAKEKGMRFEPLVAAGADTSQKDSQGVPFIHTLYEKSPYLVDSQIRRQPDLIAQADANGKTLLDLVIEKKDNPLFDTIAEINPVVKDQKGQSLFRLAILNGFDSSIQTLKVFDQNDLNDNQLLDLTVKKKMDAGLSVFLKNRKNINLDHVLQLAIQNGNRIKLILDQCPKTINTGDLVKQILKSGNLDAYVDLLHFDPTVRQVNIEEMLKKALKEGKYVDLRSLISQRVVIGDINVLLNAALEGNNEEAFNLLLSHAGEGLNVDSLVKAALKLDNHFVWPALQNHKNAKISNPVELLEEEINRGGINQNKGLITYLLKNQSCHSQIKQNIQKLVDNANEQQDAFVLAHLLDHPAAENIQYVYIDEMVKDGLRGTFFNDSLKELLQNPQIKLHDINRLLEVAHESYNDDGLGALLQYDNLHGGGKVKMSDPLFHLYNVKNFDQFIKKIYEEGNSSLISQACRLINSSRRGDQTLFDNLVDRIIEKEIGEGNNLIIDDYEKFPGENKSSSMYKACQIVTALLQNGAANGSSLQKVRKLKAQAAGLISGAGLGPKGERIYDDLNYPKGPEDREEIYLGSYALKTRIEYLEKVLTQSL